MKIPQYITWIFIGLLVLVGIVFLLRIGKDIFIQELLQDVSIEESVIGVPGIEIGSKPPHWELSDRKRDSISLSDFSGKPLVMTFWTTWNTNAADQIQILDEYLSEHPEPLFQIVAINNQEDRSAVENFIRRGGYQVKVLLDESGAVGELYEIRTLPVTYFLDAEGVVQDVFLGVLSEKLLEEKAEAIIQ